MDDALKGNFYSSSGLEGWMLCPMSSGLTDATWFQVVAQVMTVGPLRLVGFALRRHFARIVAKCKRERDEKENGGSISS